MPGDLSSRHRVIFLLKELKNTELPNFKIKSEQKIKLHQLILKFYKIEINHQTI